MKHYFTLVALAILALFMAAGLAGCSSLNYAGVASYSVQPFKAADGFAQQVVVVIGRHVSLPFA
jgi:hypothetical protein